MTVYADVLLLINFISAYILLSLTAFITRRVPTVKRRIAASAAGAALALICFCADKYALPVRMASAVLLPVIAFGLHGFDTVRAAAVFSLLSALMSGVFSAIAGTGSAYMRNGVMYFDVPAARFLMIFAASYMAITALLWFIRRKKIAVSHDLAVTLGGKTVQVTALVDSGNILKEPLTGREVIVAEWDAVKELFGGADYADLCREPDKYKLWLVPYRALGGRGTIYAFSADDVLVIDEKRRIGKIFVGITNERLSAGGCGALMGASL